MSPHKLQNEYIKEIQKINDKNKPNSLIKFGFPLVIFVTNVANVLAKKWILIMHFGRKSSD